VIECGDHAPLPGIPQTCRHLALQSAPPVSLTAAGYARQPAILGGLVRYTGTNGLDRSLETRKITLRPATHEALAIRATVTLQKKCLTETVKKGLNESVPPYLIIAASRASLRPGPFIITAFIKKTLENNWEKDYHRRALCGIKNLIPFVERAVLSTALFH